MSRIAFHYDFGSPNAYLVHKVLPDLAKRTGATVTPVPILLGGVFKATNNRSPIEAFADVAGKLSYQRIEIARFVARHRLEFNFNPHFPVMTLGVMRGAVHASHHPWSAAYMDAVFDALWVDGRKMDDPEVIAEVLQSAGLPAAQILQATQTAPIKEELIANTNAAVAQGVFGAPTMQVGRELFFGKDSLGDLEYFLTQQPH